jgi:hypothetical protein
LEKSSKKELKKEYEKVIRSIESEEGSKANESQKKGVIKCDMQQSLQAQMEQQKQQQAGRGY